MDLNEGVKPVEAQTDEELFGILEPHFGFSMVHDRVFVTWYENRREGDDDSFQFVSEPKAIELRADQAAMVQDLLNHQNDKLQALLQSFVVNIEPICDSPDGE